MNLRTLAPAAVAFLALAGTTAACSSTSNAGTGDGSNGNHVTLSLVAYSTPKDAYAKLISAFEKTPAGRGISFTESFGPSGSQEKAVAAGLSADVVNFSRAPDMDKLVSAGLVSSSWDTVGPAHGMVTDSTVAIVVRKGNPLHIHGWSDLTKSGVKLVTPNPFVSGSAVWNLMAAYGAERSLGKSSSAADSYLHDLLSHTVSQPASGSDAFAAFLAGTGNVLLSYEDEAIGAVRAGDPVQYIVPPQDILIQNPIAVVKTSKHKAAAQAFINFLVSNKGQELWAKQGYRPVVSSAATAAGVSFPTPPHLFNIDAVGGWDSVETKFFDPTNGIITKIETSLGVSTQKS
jgi:sulfate transport system substrate-binding protein